MAEHPQAKPALQSLQGMGSGPGLGVPLGLLGPLVGVGPPPDDNGPSNASFLRPRSRGRPRIRSPESARRFQRECIRQMQATRVYLGTAYQRWRSLSFMFKRTSDMAKHLLDIHERHCTVCYHPSASYAALVHGNVSHHQMRRASDSVRFLTELHCSAAFRNQVHQQSGDSSATSTVPIKQEIPNAMSSAGDASNTPIPHISCFIKKESSLGPENRPSCSEGAIDLTTEPTNMNHIIHSGCLALANHHPTNFST